MATSREIEFVLDHLQRSHPERFFKTISEGNAGVGAVLKYLHDSPDSVTAGSISEYMQVSTARVAVLLRKMNAQGLITKREDANDARVMIVSISPKGEEKAEEMKSHLYHEIDTVIDRVGMNRIMEFITISDEIKQVIAESALD